MCNSALGLQMHLRLNYLSIYLSISRNFPGRIGYLSPHPVISRSHPDLFAALLLAGRKSSELGSLSATVL